MATTPSVNLGDVYRETGLTIAPDLIRLRQGPAEKLLKDLKHSAAFDLIRLYFNLPLPTGSDWFRDAFRETDTSFSMVDNAREAAILAAAILGASFKAGQAIYALALQTASVVRLRRPTVYPALLDEARTMLAAEAIKLRSQPNLNLKGIRIPGAGKVPESAAALVQSPDWNKIAELIKLAAEEGRENAKNAVNQIFAVLSPLVAEVEVLREQTELLWWYIGGFSRVLEQPFSELPVGLAATMAGVDIADLSKSPTGPVAAPAILYKLVDRGRKGKALKITLESVVNEFPTDSFDSLGLGDSLDGMFDFCPVFSAIAKASEIGASPAWHSAFQKTSAIDPAASFLPSDLATQVFRERALLKALGKLGV
jgi:hypothetical protein